MNKSLAFGPYPSARHSTHWTQLQQLAEQPWALAQLFSQDKTRTQRFSTQAGALYMDYSKQCIDDKVMASLLNLAKSCDLNARIRALMQGVMVNTSEQRAAMHKALRLPKSAELVAAEQDVVSEVHNSLEKVETL